MRDRRSSFDWKNPAWLTIGAYLVGTFIQWGALQARLNGLESDIADLHKDIRVIQMSIMDKH